MADRRSITLFATKRGRGKMPRRAVALLGGTGAVALVLGGVTLGLIPTASASGVVINGNPSCEDVIPGSTEIKFGRSNDGVDTADGVTVSWAQRTLTTDDPDNLGDQTGSKVVDFTATGGTVLAVLVNGGPGANYYNYQPNGVTSGKNI